MCAFKCNPQLSVSVWFSYLWLTQSLIHSLTVSQRFSDWHSHLKWLIQWLTQWLTPWLILWMSQWLSQRQAQWQTKWLTKSLTQWLSHWLSDWHSDSPNNWLSDWLSDRLNDSLKDLLGNGSAAIYLLIDPLTPLFIHKFTIYHTSINWSYLTDNQHIGISHFDTNNLISASRILT